MKSILVISVVFGKFLKNKAGLIGPFILCKCAAFLYKGYTTEPRIGNKLMCFLHTYTHFSEPLAHDEIKTNHVISFLLSTETYFLQLDLN